MADPFERISTQPLPRFQTEQGVHDPLPNNAPRELKRVDEGIKDADRDRDQGNFEDYLNQSGILLLEKARQDRSFNAADEIKSGSVYAEAKDKL